MKIATPRTEADAKRAASPKLLRAGLHDGRITEASDKLSKRGNPMIELTIIVPDADGNERTLRDWLTDSDKAALRLLHAASAVAALAKYEAGEIEAADFAGRDVRVMVAAEKGRGGFGPRNVIEDYIGPSAASRVVSLREVGEP